MASTMMSSKDLELGLGKDGKLSFSDDTKITKQRTIVFVFAVMGCALVGAICWSGRTESATSQKGNPLSCFGMNDDTWRLLSCGGCGCITVDCRHGDACHTKDCRFNHPGGQHRVGLTCSMECSDVHDFRNLLPLDCYVPGHY